MVNGYLVVAYSLVWGIFMVYAWVIQRRQQQAEKELEELRKAMGQHTQR